MTCSCNRGARYEVFDSSTLTLTCLDVTNVSVCWFSLSSLENMELRDNVLKTLPSSMASLTKLRVLDLGSNLLEDLVSRLMTLYRQCHVRLSSALQTLSKTSVYGQVLRLKPNP